MTGVWVWAFAILVFAVVALTIAVTGLARRVLDALDRIEAGHAHGGNPTGRGIPLGAQAPLRAFAHAGVEAPRGAALILFMEEGCSACVGLTQALSHEQPSHAPEIELIAVVDNASEFAPMQATGWRVVGDSSRSVFRSWLVTGTPLAYLLDGAGVVRGLDIPNETAHLTALAALHVPALPHQQIGDSP